MTVNLLLLPGLNNTGAVYRETIARLPEGIRAQAPDLPALDTIEAIADAVLRDAPPRFVLAGHSFGGYVALAVLERAPERVQALALLATSARADTPEQAPKRLQAIAAVQSGDYVEIASSSTAPFHPDSLAQPALLARRREIARAYGAERYVAHVRATMARPDRTALLDGRVPLLWVTGSHDSVIPVARQREEATALPGCRFEVVDGAGHLLPLEQPAALAARLGDWIGSLPAAGAAAKAAA